MHYLDTAVYKDDCFDNTGHQIMNNTEQHQGDFFDNTGHQTMNNTEQHQSDRQ